MRYIAGMDQHADSQRVRTRLPDFCSAPVLFSLLLLAALVVLVMLLAPGRMPSLANVGVGMVFATWLTLVCGVSLCKLRPALERLPVMPAYAAVWLLIVLAVLAGSLVVWWLDQQLQTSLAPAAGSRFVTGNVAVASLVGAALLRYFYVVAQWQERVQAEAQARVQALQARIRPHFLFNSMNTVAALVRLDPTQAETTIENLAELFRAALDDNKHTATLGEELDLIDRYLAIEQLRLDDRLTVERDLAAAPRQLPLPRLLLQPLVENAVYHGIQPSRSGGTIHLAAKRDGRRLHLTISNSRDPDAHSSHRGFGEGQANVRKRLAYHFGDSVRLDAREEAQRYVVTVELPLPEDQE